jgi:integrase
MLKPTHPSLAKFSDFVQLKDYRQPTKDEYVRYVRKLGEHYRCDPATLTEDQLRAYFLFLRQDKKFGGSAMKLARCALRAFFRDCLRVAGWTVFEEVRIAPPQTLPLVLSREQVATLLGAVQAPRYRTALALIYHTGLRVGEAVRIEVRDLRDPRSPHPRLHVRCGKGGKDRFVPLAPAMVAQLRDWWKTHRHPAFLFPGPSSGWRERAQPADAARHAVTHLRCRRCRTRSGWRSDQRSAGRRDGAHVAPLLRHASAGGGRELALDLAISRARVAGDDPDLHASDAAQRGAHARGIGSVASGRGVTHADAGGDFSGALAGLCSAVRAGDPAGATRGSAGDLALSHGGAGRPALPLRLRRGAP